MRKILTLIFFSLILNLSFLAGALPQADTPSDPNFLDTEKEFFIKFPQGWQIQRDFMGLDVFAAAPIKNAHEGSLANISVVSVSLYGADLDNFYTQNFNSMEKMLENFKVIETGNFIFTGFEGKRLIFTHTIGDLTIRVMQFFILQNNRGYIITCSAKNDGFMDLASLFEQTAKTFKIEPKT